MSKPIAMSWIKKNSIIVSLVTASLFTIGLLFIGVSQIVLSTIPSKLKIESQSTCQQQLEAKSYQLKQFILENINNSKMWLSNRQNSFFDTRWFAISFYEHNGREWILKDFKMNPVVLDVYNIAPSDYIKLELAFTIPHALSEQIQIQQGQVQGLPIFIIDASNILRNAKNNHMVRISMFSDLVTSVLHSDQTCTLNLLTTRGDLIFNDTNISKPLLLEELQKNSSKQLDNPNFEFANGQFLSKKLLKNVYAIAITDPQENAFHGAFFQFMLFNGLFALIIYLILIRIIRTRFKKRIHSIQSNIQKLSDKDLKLYFDLSKVDELTSIEEELSRTSETLKKVLR